jgi:1,4-alpha-glucan branching enzyme
MSNGPMLADADLDDDSTPIVDVVSDRDLAVTTLEREDILDTPANATMNVRMPAEPKTIEQKIEEIYGVQREPDGITFRTRFEGAEQVTVAGDFNNWNAMSTPLSRVRPGVFMAKLSLRPGRYRYRLIVDGRWVTDPYNTYVEANSFGELNNVVEVD